MISAIQSTCSLFSWMHHSSCTAEKSPLEEIGSGLWRCIINCATGKAARAVLCREQQLEWVTAPLSFMSRGGHVVRTSRTLWRSGRKLPPGNIPKSQHTIILKKVRRKLPWLCLPHKCPFAGVRFREHDKRWQYEFRLLPFPADYPPRATKLLPVPTYKGSCWSPVCSVRSSSFLEVQLENMCLLWTFLVIYMVMWVLGWSFQCAERSSCPWCLVASNKRSRKKKQQQKKRNTRI